MKNYIFLFTILISTICVSQNDTPERKAFELKLAVDGERYYATDIAKSPYFVGEKSLQLYPGETLFIETEIRNDTIYSMKAVKDILHPEKTILVEFKQSSRDNVHQQMVLSVKNPFNKSLKYDAFMFILGQNDWVSTSIVPVSPKLGSYELWSDIIISLVLEKWRLE